MSFGGHRLWHAPEVIPRTCEDSQVNSKQKFGIRNTKGWTAYELGDDLFIKNVRLDSKATYPDLGCNFEFFTMPGFLEIESLGPLVKLEPSATTEHVEKWRAIPNVDLPKDEIHLIDILNPLLKNIGLPTIMT